MERYGGKRVHIMVSNKYFDGYFFSLTTMTFPIEVRQQNGAFKTPKLTYSHILVIGTISANFGAAILLIGSKV